MGFILLGIVLCVGLIVLVIVLDWYWNEEFFVSLAAFIVIFGILAGIFTTPLGYSEYELEKETQLVSLNNSIGRDSVYVSISSESTYTYYYEIDSEFLTEGDKSYKSGNITGKNISVIENNSIKEPVLQVYKKHGIKSFWSFAALSTSYQYVFRVPEGTIVYNMQFEGFDGIYEAKN